MSKKEVIMLWNDLDLDAICAPSGFRQADSILFLEMCVGAVGGSAPPHPHPPVWECMYIYGLLTAIHHSTGNSKLC